LLIRVHSWLISLCLLCSLWLFLDDLADAILPSDEPPTIELADQALHEAITLGGPKRLDVELDLLGRRPREIDAAVPSPELADPEAAGGIIGEIIVAHLKNVPGKGVEIRFARNAGAVTIEIGAGQALDPALKVRRSRLSELEHVVADRADRETKYHVPLPGAKYFTEELHAFQVRLRDDQQLIAGR